MIDPTIRPFYATASDEKTSSVTIDSGLGAFCGCNINTDGSNDATIIFYDNTAASGKKLYEHVVLAADVTGGFIAWPPIEYTTGLHVSISGTGASVNVYYVPRD